MSISCLPDSWATCQNNEIPWRNSCYSFFSNASSFHDAQAHCKLIGGYLAEVGEIFKSQLSNINYMFCFFSEYQRVMISFCLLTHQSKIVEGIRVISKAPPRAGTLSRLCNGSLKSNNSVIKINTAESLQKNKSNWLADENGLCYLWQVVVWIIHLYLYIYS